MAINIIGITDINGGLAADPVKYARKCEAIYNGNLAEAAEKIRLESKQKPLVLLSGPSGSGKTTSALRISHLLRNKGLNVHTISMDNYFLPSGEGKIPLDENGNVDLESPLRMDIPLFSEHLEKLFRCEPVAVPSFNFKSQSRTFSREMRRQKNEIIIIEGIHALNPEVTGDTDDFTTCIYVSVRTRIRDNGGTLLHPRTIRLMRRICRDMLFRGRDAKAVFTMVESVNRGEDLYIMPHKHRADLDIDTFLAYEPSVYKNTILPELEKCPELAETSVDYSAMLKALTELSSFDVRNVPADSMVREFIGGSILKY